MELGKLKLDSVFDESGGETDGFKEYLETHRFDPSIKPPEESPLLFHNDTVIGHRGANIITVTGKAKSRKTVVTSAIASGLVSVNGFLGFNSKTKDEDIIVHLDTEQGYFHYYNSVDRIFKQVNIEMPDNFESYHTRDATHEFRLELLEYIFENIKPTILIVDGITDFVYDINDQKEAKQIGDKFLVNSAKYDTLVIAVIHTTKSTGMMTGAIGTYLEKKCETSIKVELDEEDRMISHVSCMQSRNKPFSDFSITMNELTGFYELVDEALISTKGTLDIPFNQSKMNEIIEIAFNNREHINSGLFCNLITNKATSVGALKKECAEKWIDIALNKQLINYKDNGYVKFEQTIDWQVTGDLPF